MKEQNLNIRYMVAQLSELSQQEQELVNRAKAATSNAYANYSHFYVGAALLLGDGRIVIGANQENAAFPSGLCAERSAIFGAQSNYPDQPILTLAIAARNENGFLKSPISPCGACRQDRLVGIVALGTEDGAALGTESRREGGVLLVGSNHYSAVAQEQGCSHIEVAVVSIRIAGGSLRPVYELLLLLAQL
jgi:cytidine deaminase